MPASGTQKSYCNKYSKTTNHKDFTWAVEFGEFKPLNCLCKQLSAHVRRSLSNGAWSMSVTIKPGCGCMAGVAPINCEWDILLLSRRVGGSLHRGKATQAYIVSRLSSSSH
eukprot:scaffold13780_cov19-Prasinocladus_malaysianus.AAC.1